jgi:hypothetical protein
MESLDDFDSLLKGVSGKHNNELLTEKSLSKMIDERLTTSRKSLISALRSEIILIIVCMLFLAIVSILNGAPKDSSKSNVALMIVYGGTIFYLLLSLFLLIRLMYVLPLQKGTHIKEYITELYKKTQSALQAYHWLSDIAGFSLIIALLIALQPVTWFWIVFVTALSGVVIHYTNSWYIRKRFGKRLNEIKTLIDAFN